MNTAQLRNKYPHQTPQQPDALFGSLRTKADL
jgi:hypothetical protein